MQSYLVQAAPAPQIIRLPAGIELPTPTAGAYVLPQPDSREWTATLMIPLSAVELDHHPDIQRLVMHLGGFCAPPPPPLALPRQSHPASRPCHLRVLP